MATSRGPLRPSGPGPASLERFNPAPCLSGLVRHHWVPRWDVSDGAAHEQRILAYPSCNLVVEIGGSAPAPEGRLYGPVIGLSRKFLSGRGAAFGVLLQPAAGALLSDVPMEELADSSRPAKVVGFTAGTAIAGALRESATLDGVPTDSTGVGTEHATGVPPSYLALFEEWLTERLNDGVDEEGLLINRIADEVEHDGGLLRVRELAFRFGMGERALQRLVHARLGLTPKWLIQRRRLQEAAHRLAQGTGPDLARLAYALDYADQAHFSRDFSSVTEMTPTQYLRQPGTAPTTHYATRTPPGRGPRRGS